MTMPQCVTQVLYRYEQTWSASAQRNLLWRLAKLLYTELTLQYLGTAFMVRLHAAIERSGRWRSWCMHVLRKHLFRSTSCSLVRT